MKPYYQDKWVTIYHGDCREPTFANVSAIVTDPPYELGFMGKAWDSKGVSFQKETWEHLRKSCLSGSPLLSFGGTRTFHRIACAIEDAGWEIRDTIMWVYGSGFPKSLDIGKAVDKLEGNEREVIGKGSCGYQVAISKKRVEEGYRPNLTRATIETTITKGTSVWEGYGTALKPAYEPILLCMNPLDGTFAENALKHKVAGLNIDGTRVGMSQDDISTNTAKASKEFVGIKPFGNTDIKGSALLPHTQGRFPANFIHDGSQMVMELFPDSKPTKPHKVYSNIAKYEGYGSITQKHGEVINYDETNDSAARFFKKCEIDLSDLCFTLKYDTMSVCKIIYVHTAGRLLEIIQAIIENTARLNVVDSQDEQSDPLVKSAVSHADLCEILTALVLARIKTLASSPETLQVIRDYTSNSKECIQLLNLVSSAEVQASIDITQITTSLLTSFGYVNPATTNYTQETRKSEPHRFLYTPKASKAERDRGCEGLEETERRYGDGRGNSIEVYNTNSKNRPSPTNPKVRNNHPTVKPLALMKYLCNLVKMPEYNLVLDPFCGSGTTLLACIKLEIPCIGIDNDEHSCEIAARRCSQEVMNLEIPTKIS